MYAITPTKEMVNAAKELKTGAIMIVYKDDNAIRMETLSGENPYVWRGEKWRVMRR